MFTQAGLPGSFKVHFFKIGSDFFFQREAEFLPVGPLLPWYRNAALGFLPQM